MSASTLSEAPRRLIGVSTLSRFFAAGASIAARSLRYEHVSDLIMSETLSPQRVASTFKLSACKTAKTDAAFVLLVGSIAKHRAHSEGWSAEPEGSIARGLIGNDFNRMSDQAARFVKAHWLTIKELASGAAAV